MISNDISLCSNQWLIHWSLERLPLAADGSKCRDPLPKRERAQIGDLP